MITSLTLRVDCDRSASHSVSVTLGAGWVRVEFHQVHFDGSLGLANLLDLLEIARTMLRAAMPDAHSLSASARVVVTGPDAPEKSARTALAAKLLQAWQEAPAWGAERPVGETADGARAPAQRPEGAAGEGADEARAPVRPGAEEAYQVEQMVKTVRSYAGMFGATPNFRSTRPGDRLKAYNYIKSTTSQMQAPESLLEAVRLRLADEL